jgi:hypothetical protein
MRAAGLLLILRKVTFGAGRRARIIGRRGLRQKR